MDNNLPSIFDMGATTEDDPTKPQAVAPKPFSIFDLPVPSPDSLQPHKIGIAKPETDNSLKYEGMEGQFTKSVAQAILSPFQIVAQKAALGANANPTQDYISTKIKVGLNAISGGLNSLSNMIQPGVDPNHPNASALSQTAGELAGSQAINTGMFGGARKLLGTSAIVNNPLVMRATNAIGSIAKEIGDVADRTLSPSIAPIGSVGKVVAALPKNIAASALVGLPTGQSAAQIAGFGLLGSASDAGFGPSGYDPNKMKSLSTPKPVLDPASQRIQNQLGVQKDIAGLSGFDKLTDLLSNPRQNVIDRTTNVGKMENSIDRRSGVTGKLTTPVQDLFKLTAGIPGKINVFLKNRPFSGTAGTPVFHDDVPAIAKVLETIKPDQLDELNRILVSARVLDEQVSSQYQQGAQAKGLNPQSLQGPQQFGAGNIDTGIDPADASIVLRRSDPSLIQAATHFTDNSKIAIQYAVDNGMLDAGQAAVMSKVADSFIDLKEIMDGPMPERNGPQAASYITGKNKIDGKHKLEIPTNTVPDFINRTIRGTDRNLSWNALAEVARNNPIEAQDWMQQIESGGVPNQRVLEAKASALQAAANSKGIPMTNMQALQIAHTFHEDIFDKNANVLTLFNKGVLEHWQINPELAKVWSSFNPVDSQLASALSTPLRAVAKGVQVGIVKNPVFSLMHGFVDTFLAKAQSQNGFEWGVDSAKGLFAAATKNEDWQKWQAAGGGGGTLGDRSVYSNPFSPEALVPKTTGQVILTNILNPITALSKLSQPIYDAAKLGEFMKAEENGVPTMQAVLASRKVTPDMGQIGGSMKFLSGISAFLNPAIQHIDNYAGAIKANPGQMFLRGVGSVTIPTLALYMANHGDKQIEDMRKSPNGTNYWYVRLNDDFVGRVKKPYLLGYMFGTMAEEALDAWYDKDPNAFLQAKIALQHEAGFSFIPQGVQVAAGLWANKDYYTGGKIVPDGMEGIDPQYQTGANTTPLATTISHVGNSIGIPLSPIKIDYAIRGSTGDLGVDFARVFGDKKSNITPHPAQWPVVGKFFASYPSKAVEPLTSMYANADDVEQAYATMKNLENTNAGELPSYIKANINKIALAPVYTEAKGQIAKINKTIAQIANFPDKQMSPDGKRLLIDQLIKTNIEIARSVNESVGQTGLLSSNGKKDDLSKNFMGP